MVDICTLEVKKNVLALYKCCIDFIRRLLILYCELWIESLRFHCIRIYLLYPMHANPNLDCIILEYIIIVHTFTIITYLAVYAG